MQQWCRESYGDDNRTRWSSHEGRGQKLSTLISSLHLAFILLMQHTSGTCDLRFAAPFKRWGTVYYRVSVSLTCDN
jgi:hypothetical protein